MFESDSFALQIVRSSRTKKKGSSSFDNDFQFISGEGFEDGNEDPWNLDAAIRFAKHKQESVSWCSNLGNHTKGRLFLNSQFMVQQWTRAVLSCPRSCCKNNVWNMSFHLLPWSFCGQLNCFLSYIIWFNYNLFLASEVSTMGMVWDHVIQS